MDGVMGGMKKMQLIAILIAVFILVLVADMAVFSIIFMIGVSSFSNSSFSKLVKRIYVIEDSKMAYHIM